MAIIKPSTAFKAGDDWVSGEVRSYIKDQVATHVDTVADVNDNDFEQTRFVYVRSKAALYRLNLSSGAADDGDTVLHDNIGRRYEKLGGILLREMLSGNRTYYVRTDGSDSNSGLANTSGVAFLTIQKAVDAICSIDTSIYQATVQIADGTYAAAVILKRWVGALPPIIQGNAGTPANVVISPTGANCFTNDGNPAWVIKDMKLQTTTAGRGLEAKAGGTILFSNLNFGQIAQQQMLAGSTGYIRADGNFAVSGGGFTLAQAAGGYIDISGRTVTFSGTVNYSLGTVLSNRSGANVDCYNMTFTNGGIVTGARYSVTVNGSITVAGAGTSYLPGNSAGSAATGGQYA